MNYQINCADITVRFGGNANWTFHQWDFGDGSPIITGQPPVFHTYVDVNHYLSPITARHFTDQWCDQVVEFPGIFLGTGCGSQRKVSDMVAGNKLPPNELVGKTLYIFGNLEVDIPYKFNGCNIFVSSGGKITVKSGGALTLKTNTIVDLHFISGDTNCNSLWNGIEVFSGGSLTTDGASIQNAYFAVRPIQDNPNNFPVLSLRNTTFKRDFVGIYSADGNFVLSNFRDNTFEGSGNTAIYPTSTCSQVNGLTYAQRTYCGIYFNGSLGGSLLMPNKSLNNVFKDLQAGIVCINGTGLIRGCRFDNIAHLPNNTALYQATAITFIDNAGKRGLTVVGLGKFGNSTVNNCERGIYAMTSRRPSGVNISFCRMTEVQNGIEIDATVNGNFSGGIIKDNYIRCTKYLPNIKERSIGILWRDPSILFSNFSITSNKIDIDQPEAYLPPSGLDEDILPTGINVVAMHNQASSAGMILEINTNQVDLIKGHRGIVVENAANANIESNNIVNNNPWFDLSSNFPMAGIYAKGGYSNRIACNTATDNTLIPAAMVAFVCQASPKMTLTQNSSIDFLGSISFQDDNNTDCIVSYNNIETVNVHQQGIFYINAQTGPQHLEGNDWIGDFAHGAEFAGGAFPYCNSRYHVSPEANVANAINPVGQGSMQNCGNWFTVEGVENDYTCGGTTGGGGTPAKNEADLNLAGGGTLSLSPGYKWSSEMGLIRKFTENPELATGDAVINEFLQAQQGQPVAAMYAVRNGVNSIEGSIAPALLTNIQNTLAQLEANEANLLIFLENIDTDPNALASFTTLCTQTKVLEQLLQTYLASASSSMAISAATVRNANNSISSSALPCAAERYINGLYLETQVIAPRALTTPELEAVQQFGMNCPKDAGNVVYLARAWYYLQTGVSLNAPCSSFAPPMEGGERNGQSRAASLSDMVLTPNPANDHVTVTLPAYLGECTLLITDIWGKLLLQRKIPESESASALTIPTEGFVMGIYLVSVKAKAGKPLTKRLTITH